jgi:MFS transporter, ACS family, hexuronate transporter
MSRVSPPIRHLRWYIAGLLCLATALNYLDRQTLSVLASTIQKDLGMSTIDYSKVTSAFLISYSIMYAVSGRLIDRLGTRRGLLIFVTLWSFANMLHGFARNAAQLGFFRVLLGATEAAHFPACVKAVAEWFPVRERALAVGLANAGVAVGNAVAVPLVSFVTLAYGWQSAFFVTGAIGLTWVVAWFLFYRLPAEHPRLGDDERKLIDGGQTREETVQPGQSVPLGQILRMRETWGCILSRVLTDPVSYFLYFWMPKYLQEAHGFNLAQTGKYGWIPFLALAVGSVASGAVPRALIARGWPLDRARKTWMLIVTCSIPVFCLLLTRVNNAGMAVALVAALMFAHAAWGNMTLPAEIFPRKVVGTVTGLGGALGGLAGALTQLVIGRMVQTGSFAPAFVACSVLYVLAFLAVAWLLKDLGRVRLVGVVRGEKV